MKTLNVKVNIDDMQQVLKKYKHNLVDESLNTSIHIDCDTVVNFDFGCFNKWAAGALRGDTLFLWNLESQAFDDFEFSI